MLSYMLFLMTSWRHQFQIFNAIIQSISVLMMNYFFLPQRAIQVLFHDVTMLIDSFAVNIYKSVSISANRAFAVFISAQRSFGVAITLPALIMFTTPTATNGLTFTTDNRTFHTESILSNNSLQQARIPGPGGAAAAGGGGGIALRCQVALDPAPGSGSGVLDAGCAANAGDLIVAIAYEGTASGTQGISTVCDSTTSGTCTVSASTYTKGTVFCNLASSGCVNFAWTCNAAASARFVTITNNSTADENFKVAIFSHNVTGTCLDQIADGATSGAMGATPATAAFTTGVANEVAIAALADDNNCGQAGHWNGSAGSGYTLLTTPNTCNSMLGAGEYQIFSSIQTSVTATFTAGNSSANTNWALEVRTFK